MLIPRSVSPFPEGHITLKPFSATYVLLYVLVTLLGWQATASLLSALAVATGHLPSKASEQE